MKVIIAHDFIRHGGADKVLEQLHALWPDAAIHTLLAEDRPQYKGWDIHSSWLQGKVPPERYRWPLPLFQGMVDRLPQRIDWSGVDLLITSSVSFMKNLQAPAGIPHLSYIYRPAMFAYDRQDMFLSGYPAPLRPLLRAVVRRFKRWDQKHANNPDLYVSISDYVAAMVRRSYGKESRVLYPPVETETYRAAGLATEAGDYYFTALRLEGYKRVDLAVQACTRLGLPLKVAGSGPMRESLEKMAGPTVEFLGFVSDEDMLRLVAGCKVFLFPPEEDFGIAPVEALAAGRPVIALGYSGPAETVADGLTGVHLSEQSVAAMEAAIARAEDIAWDAEVIRRSADRFSVEAFRSGMQALAEEVVAAGPRGA